MILYDDRIPAGFAEFGIQIPIRDSRSLRTFAALAAAPHLSTCVERWHRRPDPTPVDSTDIARTHTADYVARLYSDRLAQEIVRTYELVDARGDYHRYQPADATRPLTDLFHRIRRRAAGSIEAGRLALDTGFCFYFGGGMHHAMPDHGAGFCLINDIVIAIRRLQAEDRIRTAWVIDVDAHKGDGTAAITADDPSITTLSIHMAHGWPLDQPEVDTQGRPNLSFSPSDIDVPIAVGEESKYNDRLAQALDRLEARPRPDLVVVVSGADPYEHDQLPSTAGLRLSAEQLFERDRLVFDFLRRRRLPSAYLMAGGYGDRVWEVYSRFLLWALPACIRP